MAACWSLFIVIRPPVLERERNKQLVGSERLGYEFERFELRSVHGGAVVCPIRTRRNKAGNLQKAAREPKMKTSRIYVMQWKII